jgi:hypothetical protein
VIEVTIEGIGTLRNEYVAAPVGKRRLLTETSNEDHHCRRRAIGGYLGARSAGRQDVTFVAGPTASLARPGPPDREDGTACPRPIRAVQSMADAGPQD